VYNFFDHYLGLDADKLPYKNGFDESFVTILPKSDLQVFNDQNPIPANALKGNDAVLAYLKIH
jgi:hypothetical protein